MAKLKSNLSKIGREVRAFAGEAMQQTAKDIVNMTQQLTPVDTGALRDSYHTEEVSAKVVRVGSDIEYAPYVEFGTSRMGAQPHFVPAFAQAEETFKARLEQAAQASLFT